MLIYQRKDNPTQIYKCAYPECSRTFFRQDLKERHEERHVAGKPHSKVNQRRKSSVAGSSSSHRLQDVAMPVKKEPAEPVPDRIGYAGTAQDPHSDNSAPAQISLAASVPVANPSVQSSSLPSPAWSDSYSVGRPGSSSTQHTGNMAMGAQPLDDPTSPTGIDRMQSYGSQDDAFSFLFPNYNNMSNQLDIYAGVDGFNFESDFQDLSPHMPDSISMEESSPSGPPPHPMAVSNLIQSSSASQNTSLSEAKRVSLVNMIEKDFDERDKLPGTNQKAQKEALLKGDQTSGTHVLSLGMLTLYLHQFWSHFDPQLPILHRPTFVPDDTPNLLIIAMIILGASCLERSMLSHETTNSCADLANFLAWHLRWALFRDKDFAPPAQLWVFQALLLLETYEKMYSTTRAHHERAHLHHGTTLTLLKRGPFLAGKSTNNPARAQKTDQGYTDQNLWWQNWIIKEGTRRVVLAAFVMDTTHQTFFGHEMVLNIHEMKLPLPCDECYWTASSASEIAKLQNQPGATPLKPTNFLDSLKMTLNGEKVQTNIFGRTVLMAGLLNVGWHMSKRDELVSNLGVAVAPRGEEKWKTSLKRAFNFWRRDFDESLAHLPEYHSASPTDTVDNGNVFESRTVMHHLAFMWLYVDMVDIQIFAHSKCLLGRNVTAKAFDLASQRVKEWATSPGAREAVFHALKFLSDVLTPETASASTPSSSTMSQSTTAPSQTTSPTPSKSSVTQFYPHSHHHHPPQVHRPVKLSYSAREDPLLNRPWVLYHAALIVWAYGYALEGPVSSNPRHPPPTSLATKIGDMYAFLGRVGGVRTPEELLSCAGQRNGCVGLLMVLRDLFRDARWELLREASDLLGNCVELLVGGSPG